MTIQPLTVEIWAGGNRASRRIVKLLPKVTGVPEQGLANVVIEEPTIGRTTVIVPGRVIVRRKNIPDPKYSLTSRPYQTTFHYQKSIEIAEAKARGGELGYRPEVIPNFDLSKLDFPI